ncbi:hypothetical protein TWF281_004860 [Arthrobotrys megalospora]
MDSTTPSSTNQGLLRRFLKFIRRDKSDNSLKPEVEKPACLTIRQQPAVQPFAKITSLAIELQAHILSFLPPCDQVAASKTCKLWEKIVVKTDTMKKDRYILRKEPGITAISKLLVSPDGITFAARNGKSLGLVMYPHESLTGQDDGVLPPALPKESTKSVGLLDKAKKCHIFKKSNKNGCDHQSNKLESQPERQPTRPRPKILSGSKLLREPLFYPSPYTDTLVLELHMPPHRTHWHIYKFVCWLEGAYTVQSFLDGVASWVRRVAKHHYRTVDAKQQKKWETEMPFSMELKGGVEIPRNWFAREERYLPDPGQRIKVKVDFGSKYELVPLIRGPLTMNHHQALKHARLYVKDRI